MRSKLSLGKAVLVLAVVLCAQVLIGLIFVSIAHRAETNALQVELGAAQGTIARLENRIDRQNRKMLQLYDQIDQAMFDTNRRVQSLEQRVTSTSHPADIL